MRRFTWIITILFTFTFPVWSMTTEAAFNDGDEAEAAEQYENAIELIKSSASKGYAQSQFALAMLHCRELGVEKDYAQSVKLLKAAAKGGFVDAQFELGTVLIIGDLTNRDFNEGFYWLEEAAKDPGENAAIAMNMLGFLYERHNDIKNLTLAAHWYRKSYLKNNVLGTTNWGRCLLKGIGVDADSEEALSLLSQAMKVGYREAFYIIGEYQLDIGKIDEGIKNLEKASSLGSFYAQEKLFEIYYTDDYKVRNLEKSLKWYFVLILRGRPILQDVFNGFSNELSELRMEHCYNDAKRYCHKVPQAMHRITEFDEMPRFLFGLQ